MNDNDSIIAVTTDDTKRAVVELCQKMGIRPFEVNSVSALYEYEENNCIKIYRPRDECPTWEFNSFDLCWEFTNGCDLYHLPEPFEYTDNLNALITAFHLGLDIFDRLECLKRYENLPSLELTLGYLKSS